MSLASRVISEIPTVLGNGSLREKTMDPSDFVRPLDVHEDATLTVVRVPAEWARWRIDRVVQATFHRMSRNRVQNVVRLGAYSPDGRKLKSGQRVREDDLVLLYRAPFEEGDVPLELPILYEDDVLLAVDKPAGLPVHPSARWIHKTVISVLTKARPGQYLTLCHRIDRETSGVLLLAKRLDAERVVKKMLEARGIVEKRYLCITWGLPEPRTGRVTFPLALDENNPLRVKMRLAEPSEPEALEAATRYTVISSKFTDPPQVGRETGKLGSVERGARTYALVACDLETGRQHQIRAHMQALGNPLVGDKLYGPDETLFARGADGMLTAEDEALLELPRHALHAHRLAFPHPLDRSNMVEIMSPLPDDLQTFWNNIDIDPT